MNWFELFKINPLKSLLLTSNPVLNYFIERDLLEQKGNLIETLWQIPEVEKILKKQQVNGSWKYPGKNMDEDMGSNHDLLETFRNLRYLVEKYGFNRQHSALRAAAEYVFSCQTEEGDIRGIISNQYMPYYMGAILELLIKAGYQQDALVEKGMNWLLSMRQEDGGWIIPLQMFKITYLYQVAKDPPIPPDRGKPSAHLATGMVLRAFAAHTDYRKLIEIKRAGDLLKSRFFLKDFYNDHQGVKYWTKFEFPFWWTDLLSSLDTLYWLGFTRDNADIARGLAWFIENQPQDGLWKGSYEKRADMHLWVTLAVCRIFKNYYSR